MNPTTIAYYVTGTGLLITVATAFFLWRYANCVFPRKYPAYVSLGVITLLHVATFLVLGNIPLGKGAFVISISIGVFLTYGCMLFLWDCQWSKALLHAVVSYGIAVYAKNIASFLSGSFIGRVFFSDSSTQGLSVTTQILISTGCILLVLILLACACNHDKKKMAFSIATVLIDATLLLIYLEITSAVGLLLVGYNLAYFIITYIYNKKLRETAELESQLQREHDYLEYYKQLLEQQENQGVLIHDLKNHLKSMEMLIKQGNFTEAENYIQQLVSSAPIKNDVRVCDNPLLNAILLRYRNLCATSHIELRLDIRSESLHHINENDLTALFCNLLDNALEAASLQDDSFIELNIHKREGTPFTVITLQNSCLATPFASDGKTLPSSKPQNTGHGFGLKSIKRIVQKYDGEIQMYYDDNTLTFHTIITLKNQDAH